MRPFILFLTLGLCVTAGCRSPCPGGEIERGVLIVDGDTVIISSFTGSVADGEWEPEDLVQCTAAQRIVIDGENPQWDFLNNIETVAGEIWFKDSATGLSGPLKGFDSLVSAGGLDLDTLGFDAITAFGALEVVGDLLSSGWYDVSEGFGALRIVAGDLWLNNASGGTAAGFSNVQSVGGSLRLWQVGFSDLSDFSQLTSIGGHLEIQGSPFTTLGFNALETVGRSLTVTASSQLAEWNGFASLRSIGAGLAVVGNPLLESEEVLEWSTTVEIGGMINVCENLGAFDDRC